MSMLHAWALYDARMTECMVLPTVHWGGGDFVGIILWENFVFKEGGENFPWRNLGVSAVAGAHARGPAGLSFSCTSLSKGGEGLASFSENASWIKDQGSWIKESWIMRASALKDILCRCAGENCPTPLCLLMSLSLSPVLSLPLPLPLPLTVSSNGLTVNWHICVSNCTWQATF